MYRFALKHIEIPIGEFYHLLISYIAKYRYWATYGHRLSKFKNIHQGKRCFIIGNGPSIRKQDLTKLNNEITFVVNWFVLHEQYPQISPTYYCISTAGYFRMTTAELRETNNKLHRLLLEKTKNATKFFNRRVQKYVESASLFPGHEVYYLNHAYFMDVHRRGMSRDITRSVNHGNTVIIDFCLHLALYMGFSEIYLLGCDCDIQFQSSGSSDSHFHPENPVWGVFKKIETADDAQKHGNFWYNNVVRDYSIVKKTFEQRGSKVYNAGYGGKLEVFERVNYDDLFPN
ncbi:6-hydroxymethylpterin diphosphokinase MptE-like protein [Chloroflexota bacterium]